MSTLEEFLTPLHHGVWEVNVPKESVTEPLGPGWVKSRFNVPSPGTVASYRNGQYHAHETVTEWRVHLDNHDPERHPFLHLIDDAPLLLMIGDTFVTLIADTREKTGEEGKILEGQTRAWHDQVFTGLFTVLIGLFVITNPIFMFRGMIQVFVPLAIIGLGSFTLWQGIQFKPFRILPNTRLYRGTAIIFTGIIAFFLPLAIWMTGILGILALWMLASAVVLLGRARKGRAAIPEGFASRVVIAIVSLLLVGFILIDPTGAVGLLMVTLGMAAFLLGVLILVNGVRLRKRMTKPH